MNRLKCIYAALMVLMLLGCRDEELIGNPADSGDYHYVLHASFAEEATRVSVSVDDLDSGLDLHWEEGDVIVLTPADDSSAQYEFKAVPYIYNTESMDPVRPKGSDELGENEILVYFFEYQGSEDIPNADHFTGTATYKPSDYLEKSTAEGEPDCKSRVVLEQAVADDPSHLRKVESLTASLEDVELAKNAYSWVKNNEWENNFFDHHDHVVFQHTGSCYAYLKVILHGFKYSIWGGGSVNVYIMDETPDMVNDEYVPDGKITFGNKDWNNNKVQITTALPNLPKDVQENIKMPQSAKFPKSDQTPFIDVPEYWELDDQNEFQKTTHPEWFDPYTQNYIKDDIYATFYVPVDPVTIPGGQYIDVVLQDGWSGDLYVWQKKVPYTMKLEAGKMYTLDYRDKRTEYALEVVKNVTYMRSCYLEQVREGVVETAPLYDLKGNKAVMNGVSVHPNRFAYPDKSDFLNANDVKEMRKHNVAFYINKDQMAGICRTYFQYFGYNADGTWQENQTISWDEIAGEVLEDNVRYSKEYMQKITKGYIPQTSDTHIGNVCSTNESKPKDFKDMCIEYVLQNRFDPVRQSSKTSNLWRSPYGRDVRSLCKNDCALASYPTKDENGVKYITIENLNTGHRFCLPYLGELVEQTKTGVTLRGTKFDGSDGNTSTWGLRSTPFPDWRVTNSISVRSFGANNSAYMQTTALSVKTEDNKGLGGLVANFSAAFPVLPVFKWRESKMAENERMIRWENVQDP